MADNGISVYGFVVFGVLVIIGILMINSVVQNNTNLSTRTELNSYSFNFTQNPSDGELLTLDNVTFEFDNNGSVTNGRLVVPIGTNATESVSNLKQVIQGNTTYEVV